MLRAIELGRLGMTSGLGGPFGAVIVRDGQLLAEGQNRVTSRNDPTAHAEIEAIRTACSQLDQFSLAGCEIYSSCEPCPMCLGAIHWARLERLTFGASRDVAAAIGFDDARLYAELALAPAQRQLRVRRVAEQAAAQMMYDWRELAGRRDY